MFILLLLPGVFYKCQLNQVGWKCCLNLCPLLLCILLIIAMDWIVSSTNSYVEVLTPSGMVFEDTRELACPLALSLPGEDTARRWLSVTRKRAVTCTWPCWHSDLRLPASRTVRKQLLFFKSPRLWYFVMVSWADKDSYWERNWNIQSKLLFFFLSSVLSTFASYALRP